MVGGGRPIAKAVQDSNVTSSISCSCHRNAHVARLMAVALCPPPSASKLHQSSCIASGSIMENQGVCSAVNYFKNTNANYIYTCPGD